MEKKKILIDEIKMKYANGKATLTAEINDEGIIKELKYSVDETWGEYLTYERSDAFVVALLYYAMIKNADIEWITPCNAQLIYQLTNYLIPVYNQEFEVMHLIDLKGPLTEEEIHCWGG